MSRWSLFLICALLGVAMVLCGLLVPAHLRAVDVNVLKEAGKNTPTLVEEGFAFVNQTNLGAAQLLARAAEAGQIPNWEKLVEAVNQLALRRPDLQLQGSESLVPLAASVTNGWQPGRGLMSPLPFAEFLVRRENRQQALDLLEKSYLPAVRELLQTRSLTNTVIFPASQTSSGQAFDTAVAMLGLLMVEGHTSSELNKSVLALASRANRDDGADGLEQLLLDVMSLGQRLNHGQLAALLETMESPEEMRVLANELRKDAGRAPVIFAAVHLTKKADGVADYLTKFSKTGVKDLALGLRYGAGGLNELLKRQERLHVSDARQSLAHQPVIGPVIRFASDSCLRAPGIAMTVKWLLIAGGGFFLAASVHYARRTAAWEQPLEVRGFHFVREFLFALGFLFAVLLVSEPFLAQDEQKGKIPFQVRIPGAADAGKSDNVNAIVSSMNQTKLNLLTMAVFFVLQGLLYISCLVKLAEIRRQKVPPHVRLRLLKNEDHLFDAGLYLGFLGTIVSFVVYSLWSAHQFSLMVAYSSTSFGIIFVSLFKICHLRPLCRRLVLEAEAEKVPESPLVVTS